MNKPTMSDTKQPPEQKAREWLDDKFPPNGGIYNSVIINGRTVGPTNLADLLSAYAADENQSLRAEVEALRKRIKDCEFDRAKLYAAVGPMDEFDTTDDVVERLKRERDGLQKQVTQEDLISRFLARYPPPISCLLCGHEGPTAVAHMPSGVWVCMTCRDAKQRAEAAERELAALKKG